MFKFENDIVLLKVENSEINQTISKMSEKGYMLTNKSMSDSVEKRMSSLTFKRKNSVISFNG